MSKIRYGASTIIGSEGNRRLIKFRGRYYTVFGTAFAVRGNHLHDDDFTGKAHYLFCDFNNLCDMYLDA